MTRKYSTRIFTVIVALIYLQGCATPYVIDKARGIKPISYRVESAWIDSKNQEFVLCLIDQTGLHKDKIDRFLIRIPKDIINSGGNSYIDYGRREVSVFLEETNWWNFSSYAERKDIRVYDLNIGVKKSCDSVSTNFNNLEVINSPQDINFEEALSFAGISISEKIKTHKPFAVFVEDPIYDVEFSDSIYICDRALKQPCLYLLSKPSFNSEGEIGHSAKNSYSEILSINRLVWESDKQPLWYMAIPFSIAIDAAILMTMLIIIGCAGGCGAG